jgi:hypothetical protein
MGDTFDQLTMFVIMSALLTGARSNGYWRACAATRSNWATLGIDAGCIHATYDAKCGVWMDGETRVQLYNEVTCDVIVLVQLGMWALCLLSVAHTVCAAHVVAGEACLKAGRMPAECRYSADALASWRRYAAVCVRMLIACMVVMMSAVGQYLDIGIDSAEIGATLFVGARDLVLCGLLPLLVLRRMAGRGAWLANVFLFVVSLAAMLCIVASYNDPRWRRIRVYRAVESVTASAVAARDLVTSNYVMRWSDAELRAVTALLAALKSCCYGTSAAYDVVDADMSLFYTASPSAEPSEWARNDRLAAGMWGVTYCTPTLRSWVMPAQAETDPHWIEYMVAELLFNAVTAAVPIACVSAALNYDYHHQTHARPFVPFLWSVVLAMAVVIGVVFARVIGPADALNNVDVRIAPSLFLWAMLCAIYGTMAP